MIPTGSYTLEITTSYYPKRLDFWLIAVLGTAIGL